MVVAAQELTWSRWEVLSTLIDAGADLSRTNRQGETVSLLLARWFIKMRLNWLAASASESLSYCDNTDILYRVVCRSEGSKGIVKCIEDELIDWSVVRLLVEAGENIT
eukprot:Hpha_TRINITY_DN34331_c0_g1::TRINITY_DN34331_c0_g1_i1::g.109482::m.109482